MKTTDMDSAVNSLLMPQDNSTEVETEADEARSADQDDDQENTEADQVDADEDAADEAEAGDNEADGEADEADTDEDEADENDEADKKPELISVKVDGVEKKVTLDELKRSYSGQDYIQKGMQEAAEKRKEAEAVYNALQAEQQKFLDLVNQIQEQGFKSAPKQPDPKLLDTDPIGYMQEQARYQAEMQQFQAQQGEVSRMQKQREAMQAQAMQMHLAEQAKILQERIPEFADPAKAKQVQERLVKIGSEAYGFSEQELGAITDARAVQVLHDAAKWRELQAGKAKAQKEQKAPRNVKPGAKRPEPVALARKKQLAQAKRTGKLEDFAGLLLE